MFYIQVNSSLKGHPIYFQVLCCKSFCFKNLFIVTPGIRLPGDKPNDQKRITTPKQAFQNKASAIVIGRSITTGSPKKNIKKLIDHLNQ